MMTRRPTTTPAHSARFTHVHTEACRRVGGSSGVGASGVGDIARAGLMSHLNHARSRLIPQAGDGNQPGRPLFRNPTMRAHSWLPSSSLSLGVGAPSAGGAAGVPALATRLIRSEFTRA